MYIQSNRCVRTDRIDIDGGWELIRTPRVGELFFFFFFVLAANKGPGTTRVTLWTLCRANRGFLRDGEPRRRGD